MKKTLEKGQCTDFEVQGKHECTFDFDFKIKIKDKSVINRKIDLTFDYNILKDAVYSHDFDENE